MPNTPSLKNRRVYEALRRKGMPKSQAAAISNAQVQKKDSGVTGMAIPPTGGHALFNNYGIASRRRKRKRKECSCGIVEKASGAPGESIAPGITRIHGNLCNVHGRYGPCDSGAAGKKPKGGRGRKPPKPKITPEQRAAQRNADHEKNAASVASQMAQNDTGLSPSGSKAMLAFAKGTPPNAQTGDQLSKMGLAERAQDGSYRMTPTGHAVVAAMRAGDYQRAVDAVSRGTDTAGKRTERQTAQQARQQAAATRHAQATASHEQAQAARAKRLQERAQNKPSKAGGGGSKKPAAGGKIPPAPRSVGPAKHVSRSSIPSAPALASNSKPKPKAPAKVAAPKAPKPQIAQPLRDAATALSEGTDVSDKDLQSLITNGLAKLGKDGAPVLTATGLNATKKAETYGGVKRSNLDENVFAGPDRSFPIKTAQDVKDAVMSLGRTKHDKAAVKAGIIRRARAIGATSALPDSWKVKEADNVFTVFKDAAGHDRWLAITTTAYEDSDREIISTKAIAGAVAIGDSTQHRGPLRFWHVPGLDIGDCDYQAQGGPGGRFLIESGTFRSKAMAQLGQTLAQSGYQMSPGFVHGKDQPHDGVYDAIAIYERSAVPAHRAANYFTRFTAKENIVLTEEKAAEYRQKAGDNAEALALLESLIGRTEQTDKAAQDAKITFKESGAVAPAEIEIDGVTYTIKAMAPATDNTAAASDGAAMVEGSPEEEATETPDEEAAEDDGGMDDQAFAQMIATSVVNALLPHLGVSSKMDDMHKMMGELKGSIPQYAAQKDDAAKTQATQIAALETKLKELTGDLPESVMSGARNFYRPSEAATTLLTEASAAKIKEQVQNIPTGLNDPAEIAAYNLIFGNQ